jgi:hypothetical protein
MSGGKFKGKGQGCIVKLGPSWGLRVGYKVLLILPAMELPRSIQNHMESYRRSLSQQRNIMECSGREWNIVEYGRRVRNALLECMIPLRDILHQNHLEMGRRGRMMRGYVLCKQWDDQSETDTHVMKVNEAGMRGRVIWKWQLPGLAGLEWGKNVTQMPPQGFEGTGTQ